MPAGRLGMALLARSRFLIAPAVSAGFCCNIKATRPVTTGAAMLLIRPMIRANDARIYNAHVVIFFIFLVANIGGSLTPLGDPPLFLGFLKGVNFFWPTLHLLAPMLVVSAIVLVPSVSGRDVPVL